MNDEQSERSGWMLATLGCVVAFLGTILAGPAGFLYALNLRKIDRRKAEITALEREKYMLIPEVKFVQRLKSKIARLKVLAGEGRR